MNFLFSDYKESKPFFWGARCGMSKDEKKKIDADSNIIYVGNKPPMNYVTAIMALLNSGNFTEVVLKARGNAISRAVDAAEITHNRFLTNAEVTRIDIGTETVTNEEGRKSNVSSIEICLAMKKTEK
jgi:DNA-binding protein